MCPVVDHALGSPFEVELPHGLPVSGVILADHVKSTDWRAREAELVCRLPPGVISHVMAKLKPI
jgi:mRNA interferase MazF